MKEKNYTYFQGKILPKEKVKISPYDLGLLRGYGVFDVMRARGERPFFFQEHWKRFKNSAQELKIRMPIKKEKYEKTVKKLLKINGYKESVIRTVLTGGLGLNGFVYQPGKETFFILIEKFRRLPQKIYAKGAQAITLDYKRDFPRAKITNYVVALKNQNKREKTRSLEVIYLKNGQALEASTSNFFIVKNNQLITPKKDVLLGITRNMVVELAAKNGFQVVERKISKKELFLADEVFLTATNKDVAPIVKIDGKKINAGKIGKVTKKIMSLFSEFMKNY